MILMDQSEIWSAIRMELPNLSENLKAALTADRYEIQSAQYDIIARKLSDVIVAKIGEQHVQGID